MPLRQSEDCTRVFISVRDAEEATRVVVNAMVNKKEAFGAVARSQYHSHTCALSTTVTTCAIIARSIVVEDTEIFGLNSGTKFIKKSSCTFSRSRVLCSTSAVLSCGVIEPSFFCHGFVHRSLCLLTVFVEHDINPLGRFKRKYTRKTPAALQLVSHLPKTKKQFLKTEIRHLKSEIRNLTSEV